MLIVGLSGGIACGKSTVSALLQEAGLPVIDCDALAHESTKKGSWGYRRIFQKFGQDILLNDGEIDREALGRLVFSNASARKQLNAAVHLPVALTLLKRLCWCWMTSHWTVVVDMPLLFETGMYRFMRPSVAVWCPQEVQVSRLMVRNSMTREDALSRVNSQIPTDRKKTLADIVLDNSGTLQDLKPQVDELVVKLKRKGVVWKALTSPVGLLACIMTGWLLLR